MLAKHQTNGLPSKLRVLSKSKPWMENKIFGTSNNNVVLLSNWISTQHFMETSSETNEREKEIPIQTKAMLKLFITLSTMLSQLHTKVLLPSEILVRKDIWGIKQNYHYESVKTFQI